jgi:hypothetical protein
MKIQPKLSLPHSITASKNTERTIGVEDIYIFVMVSRLQDGYFERLDSTPRTGPQVNILEEDGEDVRVEMLQEVPEAGIKKGEISWVSKEDVVTE